MARLMGWQVVEVFACKQLMGRAEGHSKHQMQTWPHLLISSSQGCLAQALQSALLLGCSPLVSCQHQLQRCIARCIDIGCQVCRILLSRCSYSFVAAYYTAWHGCNKRPRRRGSGGSWAAPRCGAGGLPRGLGVMIMHRGNRLHVAAARQSVAARCKAKPAKAQDRLGSLSGVSVTPEQLATLPGVAKHADCEIKVMQLQPRWRRRRRHGLVGLLSSASGSLLFDVSSTVDTACGRVRGLQTRPRLSLGQLGPVQLVSKAARCTSYRSI